MSGLRTPALDGRTAGASIACGSHHRTVSFGNDDDNTEFDDIRSQLLDLHDIAGTDAFYCGRILNPGMLIARSAGLRNPSSKPDGATHTTVTLRGVDHPEYDYFHPTCGGHLLPAHVHSSSQRIPGSLAASTNSSS